MNTDAIATIPKSSGVKSRDRIMTEATWIKMVDAPPTSVIPPPLAPAAMSGCDMVGKRLQEGRLARRPRRRGRARYFVLEKSGRVDLKCVMTRENGLTFLG